MSLKSTLILLSLTGAAFVASRLIGSQDHESARTESYMNNEDPSPNFQPSPQFMEDLFFSPTENPLNDTFTVTNAGGGQGAFTNLITVLELRDNWSGAGNTSTSNDSYASNSRLSVPIFGVGPLVSDALDITQFGFNIPTSATILGITATIERSANRRDASNNVTDNKITLIRGEVPIITPQQRRKIKLIQSPGQ